jgi:hypothetical protein
MPSIVEFALAVVGAVFILGCLGVAALLWFTGDRVRSEREERWDQW